LLSREINNSIDNYLDIKEYNEEEPANIVGVADSHIMHPILSIFRH
jgi:hypothetical protein